MTGRTAARTTHHAADRDRGAVDVSIEMLFGLLLVLAVLLALFEAVAHWHARNVFDDAAAEAARVAASYDGDCASGIATARAAVEQRAGSWADEVEISCDDGPIVVVRIAGGTPGILAGSLGLRAGAVEIAPKER